MGKKGGGSQYLVIFQRLLDLENFYKCLTFQGGKKHFFSKKGPNNGLVSEKKYIFFQNIFFLNTTGVFKLSVATPAATE